MKFSYLAYGLGIRSVLPLPELVAAETEVEVTEADVTIRLGRIDRLPLESSLSASESYFRATTQGMYIFSEAIGAFLIQEGREIVVDPTPGVEERMLRLYLLGPALATLLQQRGLLVLHASAVAVNGSAVAFLGWPGGGKSTTAAALHTRGHAIISDDVTAIQLEPKASIGPAVLPGFPQLRLWSETAATLGYDVKLLPKINANFDKHELRLKNGFSKTPLPIKCVYVIAEGQAGQAHEIQRLEPREALVELIRHSYCARMLQETAPSDHLRQCASLANQITVSRLQRQRSLAALSDLASLIEENIRHDSHD